MKSIIEEQGLLKNFDSQLLRRLLYYNLNIQPKDQYDITEVSRIQQRLIAL